jgi:hypothetical protein
MAIPISSARTGFAREFLGKAHPAVWVGYRYRIYLVKAQTPSADNVNDVVEEAALTRSRSAPGVPGAAAFAVGAIGA